MLASGTSEPVVVCGSGVTHSQATTAVQNAEAPLGAPGLSFRGSRDRRRIADWQIRAAASRMRRIFSRKDRSVPVLEHLLD